MQARLGKAYVALGAIAVAIVLMIVSSVGIVVSSTADFSIYNTGWNGTSNLAVTTFKLGKFAPSFKIAKTGTDISISNLGLDQIDLNPSTSALIVIGPTKPFSGLEQAIVGDFLRGGGTLLLADDFGTGNTLLEGINASARFSGEPVMDLAFEKQPDFSVCFDVRENELTKNVTTLLLNHPSSLTIGSPSVEALAYSSVASWLDSNSDGIQQWGEQRGPFPILEVEQLGSGSIILLSDPSILINGMLGYRDNLVLANNLIASICSGRSSVYFDESHRDFFNPVDVATKLMGGISVQAKILLVLLIMFVALWIATDVLEAFVSRIVRMLKTLVGMLMKLLPGSFGKRKPAIVQSQMGAEDLVADAMMRHPEWKIGTVRYLVREWGRNKSWTDRKGSR